jgi:KipI family sensor histidine kinase inhibitor
MSDGDVLEGPVMRNVGIDGLLVSFGDRLSEPANRAALAFRDALEREGPEGVEETSTSLVSTYLRFDPVHADHGAMRRRLEEMLAARNWFEATLPGGRRLWRIPTVFGTALAPQLDEAAAAAGLDREAAIRSIAGTRVRVQTIGFAPGQPYLGQLPPDWDIPRQTQLTEKVPAGALGLAIRQMVLFSVPTPTGWRHVGQTAFPLFRPETDAPFVLRPGDEVRFDPVSPETLERMKSDADGGAVSEILA